MQTRNLQCTCTHVHCIALCCHTQIGTHANELEKTYSTVVLCKPLAVFSNIRTQILLNSSQLNRNQNLLSGETEYTSSWTRPEADSGSRSRVFSLLFTPVHCVATRAQLRNGSVGFGAWYESLESLNCLRLCFANCLNCSRFSNSDCIARAQSRDAL